MTGMLTNITAPPSYKRRAMAHLATSSEPLSPLVFPLRQKTRLLISYTLINAESGGRETMRTTASYDSESMVYSVDEELRVAQIEIIEQEMFYHLLEEARSLPSAVARVSERLV